MRYRVRWSNGFWKAFDSIKFRDISKHNTEVSAIAAVADLNGKETA